MGRIWFVRAGAAALCAVLAGCSAGGPAPSPKITAQVTSFWRTCTETSTLATPTGQMRACVDYSYAGGRLKVTATAASYASNSGYDLPYFTFTFRNPSSAAVDYQFSSPVYEYENVFSHYTGLIELPRTSNARDIHPGDVLEVSLRAIDAHTGSVVQMASVALTLYPGGLLCPALGTSNSDNESTGQC
jgi:hypothetical protein